jgi:hypothetical protein
LVICGPSMMAAGTFSDDAWGIVGPHRSLTRLETMSKIRNERCSSVVDMLIDDLSLRGKKRGLQVA